jgi:hypothetical protein
LTSISGGSSNAAPADDGPDNADADEIGYQFGQAILGQRLMARNWIAAIAPGRRPRFEARAARPPAVPNQSRSTPDLDRGRGDLPAPQQPPKALDLDHRSQPGRILGNG